MSDTPIAKPERPLHWARALVDSNMDRMAKAYAAHKAGAGGAAGEDGEEEEAVAGPSKKARNK